MMPTTIYIQERVSKIRYCSAPCGSGKTRQIVNRACELVERFEKVLILQPTRELIEKTAKEEIQSRSKPPGVRIFHKGTVEGKVAKALADYVSEAPDDIPEVVFATHQVLPHLKHFENRDKWHVFVDEELQVVRYQQHQIPQTHRLLTDLVNVTRVNGIYGQVSVIDAAAVAEIARNRDNDEILETLAGTCRILANNYWETFVNIDQYERLIRGAGQVLAFHSVLKPGILNGFASVFMASANFEDSAVFKLWSQQGVEFEPDPEFARNLRYSKHPNGESVTIYYVTEQPWSRKRREQTLEDGATIPDRMIQAAKDLFPSGRFLWHANKAVTGNPFGALAERLPNKPHGLNGFADFDDIVFLSSLNPPTDHFRFLQSRGLKGYEVRGFTYFAAAYQAIMRTSIRNPESRSPKRILMPDRYSAEYLSEIFPGSEVEKLDIGIVEDLPKKRGRPRKHQSNRDRVNQQRQKAKEQKLRLLADQFGLNAPDTNGEDWENDEGRCCAENGIRLYTNFGTQPLTASIFSSKCSPIPWGYISGEVDAFVDFLRERHEHPANSKEANYLFSPAIFDPNRAPGKSRAKANIAYLQHMALDFEDGELRPEHLPELFPDLRMVVTNTFNHTSDKPRFRAIFPTSERMTPEVYSLIYGSLADKLEEAGYSVVRNGRKRKTSRQSNSRPSGLDWSKSLPTSLFYLPCQGQHPEHSFFHDLAEGRNPLTPSMWVRHTTVPLQPDFEVFELDCQSTGINDELVQLAIQTWRTSLLHPGQGNTMFFDLALSLKYAGMDFPQIESMLHSEARYGRTPNERLAQIPSIMASLRVYSETWRQRTQPIAKTAA